MFTTDVVNMEIAITYNFVILRDLKELWNVKYRRKESTVENY